MIEGGRGSPSRRSKRSPLPSITATFLQPSVVTSIVILFVLSSTFIVTPIQRTVATTNPAMARRAIKKIVTAHQQREGGGFLVRRPIGGKISEADPFLMLDHLGPSEYGPGEAVGAPDHPHRGFETVTYVLEGGFHHQDSAGNEGNLTDGWVQWMTAGSGVVHSEMPTDELLEKGGRMEGFQLWVNLPAEHKMKKPRYQDTPPDSMPVVELDEGNVWIRVIAGESSGTKAVIETHTPIMFLDIRLKPGASYEEIVPEEYDGFVYVYRGKGLFSEEEKEASMGQVLLLGSGNSISMKAPEDEECRVLLIAGVPINEPIARYGPFVMNTQEEIMQAFQDYRNGKLGQIEGAEERYAKTSAAVNTQKTSGRWKKDEL
eukprot:m.26416 g.26416  ORF g.26416 m.26416 type:complete len:374 (-) comp5856_c0_seq1:201-1322(-)